MNPRKPRRPNAGHLQNSPGAIVPEAIYRLDELKARMGWRDAAFRAAVRAGLKIYRSGKRTYVLGTDLVAFITKAEDDR
jgi:hypothetical protein